MVYLVQNLTEEGQITVVKAKDEDEVRKRMIFGGNAKIVGRLTDNDITTFHYSKFAAIQA